MKKFLSIILAIAMVFTFCGVFQPDGVIADDEPDTLVLEKPIHVTVVDELGNPVPDVEVSITDDQGTSVPLDELQEEVYITFVEEGSYTLELTDIPDGYIADVKQKSVEVTLAEGEEIDSIRARSIQSTDPNHKIFCKHDPSHLEVYKIVDNNSEITGYCFNQNYDAPDIDDPDCTYTRLVGSPWLLSFVAQNEKQGITSRELYHHVLSIIYHRDYIQQKYGFDDLLTDYIVNMALKNYTDGDMDSFKTNDENGKNMLIRDDAGHVVYNDAGHYQFYPGGSVLGSIVNHANNANIGNPDYVFPQAVKDAWHELVEMTDHPSDYFLYIYFPKNFVTKEYGIASGQFTVDNHYDNLYYADAYQALMSTFTVKPIKEQFVLRKATDIEITKVWEDNDNENQVRPSAEEFVRSIHLLADGEDVTATYADNCSVEDNQDGTYTVSFTDLPQLDDNREEITYTIKEDPIPNYTADKTTVGNGETITNTYAPPKTNIPVVKTWVDNNDNAKKRPASITINLLADGEVVQTVEVKPLPDGQAGTDSAQQNSWTYTFYDLPVYNDDGSEIVYTITEENVPEYTTTINGFTVTNTLKEVPGTGDNMELGLWAAIFGVAAVSAIMIFLRRKAGAR